MAIEWCRAADGARAVAVERVPERAARVAANAARLAPAGAVRLVESGVAEALDGLPRPDAVFIGGGATSALVERAVDALPAEGRIVDLGRLLLPKGLPPEIGDEEVALPDLAATWSALEELGGRAVVMPCANLAYSYIFLAARLLAQYLPAGGGVLRRFLPAFNASFTDPSFCHASYRHMIVFSRSGQLPASLLALPHYARPDEIPVEDEAAVAQVDALHRLVAGASGSLAEFLRRTEGMGGVAAAYMEQLEKASAHQQSRLARLEQIAGAESATGLGGRIVGRLRRIVGDG